MAWVRISSEPEFFVLVNFSLISKIAAHLRGSCLYLILIKSQSKLISSQIHIEKSRSKMSLRFDNKMFLNVLLYALKKKHLKDNDQNITEANIQGLWSVL